MWHDFKIPQNLKKKKNHDTMYFKIANLRQCAKWITVMWKQKVSEKYHIGWLLFSKKHQIHKDRRGDGEDLKNWKAVFVQITVGIIHIPNCSAISHSLHGPQTRMRWEWMEPIIFHTSGPFNILSACLKFIFFLTCLKKDPSSVALPWPNLTSLNTYYHFNVPYHAISKL